MATAETIARRQGIVRVLQQQEEGEIRNYSAGGVREDLNLYGVEGDTGQVRSAARYLETRGLVTLSWSGAPKRQNLVAITLTDKGRSIPAANTVAPTAEPVIEPTPEPEHEPQPVDAIFAFASEAHAMVCSFERAGFSRDESMTLVGPLVIGMMNQSLASSQVANVVNQFLGPRDE